MLETPNISIIIETGSLRQKVSNLVAGLINTTQCKITSLSLRLRRADQVFNLHAVLQIGNGERSSAIP
jgi:hypothetical protein